MAKITKKHLELENIPLSLQKAVALMDREIDNLGAKEALTHEDAKNLIAYVSVLKDIYKEHRAEVIQIKKELKDIPKEELQRIFKIETMS